jgi:ankyrin repeat protein
MEAKAAIEIKTTIVSAKTKKQVSHLDNLKIMDVIYANDVSVFKGLIEPLNDLNFKCRHKLTDLDTLMSPLAAAAYLGKFEIVHIILDSKQVDVNLPTEESCKGCGSVKYSFQLAFTPLIAACIAGNYEIMQVLLDNGANVHAQNAMGR